MTSTRDGAVQMPGESGAPGTVPPPNGSGSPRRLSQSASGDKRSARVGPPYLASRPAPTPKLRDLSRAVAEQTAEIAGGARVEAPADAALLSSHDFAGVAAGTVETFAGAAGDPPPPNAWTRSAPPAPHTPPAPSWPAAPPSAFPPHPGMPAPGADQPPASTPAPFCEVCGAAPARETAFRQVIGWLVFFSLRTTRGVWCRDCGRAVGRSRQNVTLATGWWGPFALVANVVVVGANTAGLNRLAGLNRPDGGDPAWQRPPRRAVFLRAGMAVPLAFVLAAGVGVVVASTLPREPAGPRLGGFGVGDCLASREGARPARVDCGGPHDGRVLSIEDHSSACPEDTDGITAPEAPVDGKPMLCIDLDV